MRIKIIAVNGRQFSTTELHHAVADSAKSTAPLLLLIKDGEYYKTLSLDYHDGEKYPHVVRNDTNGPAILDEIAKPMVVKPKPVTAE